MGLGKLGLGCCCGQDPCVGCDCDGASTVQLDGTYGDGDCGDCSVFDSVVLPKVSSFTPILVGDTCLSATYQGPCLIDGELSPVCYYQDEDELACGAGNPTTVYWRVSIHRPVDDPAKYVVIVSVALRRPAFLGSGFDAQARTGSVLWSGACDEIDVDVPLDEVCISPSDPAACVLPTTVHVTVL